jgi:DNA-binding transcriptional regulator/RsmH inhibitor MraZ
VRNCRPEPDGLEIATGAFAAIVLGFNPSNPHPMTVFRHVMMGRLEYRMDAKGRVSIPPGWRSASGEHLLLVRSRRCGQSFVAVLPQTEFDLRLRQIEEDQTLSIANKRILTAELYIRSHLATISEQGRLLVPHHYREEARLPVEGTVALLGCGSYFQIWNPADRFMVEQQERELIDWHGGGP